MTDTTQQVANDVKKALLFRLSKAKTGLILDHPFVGTIAMNMPFEVCYQTGFGMPVPTAGVDGKKVYFNPDFCGTLSDDELLFLVAHECMHPMLEHNFRRGERNHGKWNAAADYVINKLLTDEGIGTMPKMGLLSEQVYRDGSGTSEGIYAILPDDESGGEGGDQALDNCMDGEGTEADQQQAAAEWRVRTAQAAQAAKMAGKLSANLSRIVDEVLNPKVDWRDVLQRFVERCKTDSRTWARPNRRFIQQGMYLPSRDGEAVGELLFAVDCSGSCWDVLDQFAAEVRTVFEALHPLKLHVVYFDTSVSHVDTFERDDDFHMEGHGGGGTGFSCIFKHAEEAGIEPVAAIVLTDLYASDFGEDPGYPVLWVSNGSTEAPWGEVVEM